MQSGSTTRLIKRINVKPIKERDAAMVLNRRARVKMTLEARLRVKMATYYPDLELLDDEDIALNKLVKHFKKVNAVKFIKVKTNKKASDEKRIALEAYKQALIATIHANLIGRLADPPVESGEPHKKRKKFIKWLKVGLFALSNAIMLPVGAFSAFVGFQSMLPLLIPAITEGAVFGVAVGLTIVDFFLQGLSQAVSLKDDLGVALPSKVKKLLNAYAEQIKTVKEVNQLLQRPEIFKSMTREEYRAFADTAVYLNQYVRDIKSQNIFNQKPKEKTVFKVLRWGITALQALMIVGAGYFTAAALLSALAAPLLGTPAGWVIIGLVIVGMLAGYLCMRNNAMRNMMSPALKKFKHIGKKIAKFVFMDNFDHILGNKNNFKSEQKEIDMQEPHPTKQLAESVVQPVSEERSSLRQSSL